MPQDVNIFGNSVAARCFESQILKASKNPVLRRHWQLSSKASSKSKLLGAVPLRIVFCPAWGERRGQTKDSYAKGRLKSMHILYFSRAELKDATEEICGTQGTTSGYFLRSMWGLSTEAEYISLKIQFFHSLKLLFEVQNESLSI